MVYQGGENTRVAQSKTPAQITVVTSNISFGHDNNNRISGGKQGLWRSRVHGNRGAQSPEIQLHRKAHSSWLTILISPLIHQIPHYVELLPGTLVSSSHTHIHTQYHRPWEAARPAMKEVHWGVKVEAAMLLLHMHVQVQKLHVCRWQQDRKYFVLLKIGKIILHTPFSFLFHFQEETRRFQNEFVFF